MQLAGGFKFTKNNLTKEDVDNKLASSIDAITISNLKLSLTDRSVLGDVIVCKKVLHLRNFLILSSFVKSVLWTIF